MDNAANPPGKPNASIRYVDQPECKETFADSIVSVFFDGQTMRIEFGITRMDDIKPGATMSGRRYPACRLVLPVNAAVDLINKMQQTGAALQQAGVVKTSPQKTEPASAPPEPRLAGLAGLAANEFRSAGLSTARPSGDLARDILSKDTRPSPAPNPYRTRQP